MTLRHDTGCIAPQAPVPLQTAGFRKRPVLGALIVAGAIGAVGAYAQSGGTLEIRNGTIAGGGGDIAAARYQLTGSFGEAVSGTVAAEGFELTAGFPATLNKPNQIIFIDGFEPLDEQP